MDLFTFGCYLHAPARVSVKRYMYTFWSWVNIMYAKWYEQVESGFRLILAPDWTYPTGIHYSVTLLCFHMGFILRVDRVGCAPGNLVVWMIIREIYVHQQLSCTGSSNKNPILKKSLLFSCFIFIVYFTLFWFWIPKGQCHYPQSKYIMSNLLYFS